MIVTMLSRVVMTHTDAEDDDQDERRAAEEGEKKIDR